MASTDQPRAAAPPLLDPALRTFLVGPVGLALAAILGDGAVDLSEALACRVLEDGEVILVVSAPDAARALVALRAGSPIAVVFCEPSTNRTVQLKGPGVTVGAIGPEEVAALDEHRRLFSEGLAKIGFGGAFATAWLAADVSDLVTVTFTPTEAFDQTPGPRAGQPLPGARTPARTANAPRGSSLAKEPPASLVGMWDRPLGAIRECLDGGTPAIVATRSADGTPNISYLSQADWVDDLHLGLSFQFFNKTRRNVLEVPFARILVWHPASAEMFRLGLRYDRTELEGPLFERMRAKLAGIASHTGMAGVFRLRGADVYEVTCLERVPGRAVATIAPRVPRLPRLRAAIDALNAEQGLDTALTRALQALGDFLDVDCALVLAHDPTRRRLFAIASRGYDTSGVGAEVAVGEGVIGTAARERASIRLTHVTSDRTYLCAVRDETERAGTPLEREVPWPGLERPGSQVAIPLVTSGRLVGVLFAESTREGRFGYDDEDALAVFGAHLALLLATADAPSDEPPEEAPPPTSRAIGRPVLLRHYAEDDSVFLDDEYLIKGVAGAILWAMVSDHAATGRECFTNRELRLDPRIRLPALGDNLEARLVLLQRRLAERQACLRLERVGRGRLRLEVGRPVELRHVES